VGSYYTLCKNKINFKNTIFHPLPELNYEIYDVQYISFFFHDENIKKFRAVINTTKTNIILRLCKTNSARRQSYSTIDKIVV